MPSVLTPVARAGAGALFGAIAKVRADRSLHPAGVAFEARFVVERPRLRARLFARETERLAYVRFSRGFGLPEPLPETLSLAIKVPDAYGPGRDHDVLLTGTGERPLLRHVFTPGRSFLGQHYTTVFPYAVGHQTMLFGVRPRRGPRGTDGGSLDELVEAMEAGELSLDLRAATLTGPWRDIARIDCVRLLEEGENDALGFNSANVAAGIRPLGLISEVRDAAYEASIHARGGGTSRDGELGAGDGGPEALGGARGRRGADPRSGDLAGAHPG
jgi:hypothetical protein